MKISAIDLFCGAGGLTHGLLKSKINVVAGFDIENQCKFAYEQNNKPAKFFNRDVASLTGSELEALYPTGDIKLLAGCAPCQPFSKYSDNQYRDSEKNDNRWPLLYTFSRLISEIEPELVTMENVPGVIKHKVYTDFVKALKTQGYSIWAEQIYCPDYGIPQIRKRHVLLASKLGPIEIIATTHTKSNYLTVRSTIEKLPPLTAGEQCNTDVLHKAAKLSKLNLARIQNSLPGGTWKDWPRNLLADCHTKDSGKTYCSVYGRMTWDDPSPTMTTQCYGYGNGRFGHPTQDRAITLREASMFQTFPKNYQFVRNDELFKRRDVAKMIGNAVPVKLGEVIGEAFFRHFP